MDRSDQGDTVHDDFLGLKLPSEMKKRVQREAEREGVSTSELARRRLRGEEKDD